MKEKELDLIERYCRNLLSENEQKAVEQRMQEDEDFKSSVDFHRDLIITVQHREDAKLKKMFQEQEAEIPRVATEKAETNTERPSATIFTMRRVMSLAASFLFMVLAYWFYQQPFQNSTNLFADNFERYPNVIAPIERGEAITTTKEKAFAAYENKRYEEAISAFDELMGNTLDFDLLFYKANAQLAIGSIKDAIPSLHQVENSSTQFAEQAKWYLALAYLHIGKHVQAKKILEDIENGKLFNHQKANELLEKL